MEYTEISGKSLEDAISEAGNKFGVDSSDIDYEIVDMGSTGFLGIGSKPTVIKAKIKDEAVKRIEREKKENAAQAKAEEVKAEPVKAEAPKAVENKEVKAEKKAPKNEAKSEKAEKADIKVDADEVQASAKAFLEDVFKAMGIEVVIKTEYMASDRQLLVELAGNEMGVLIGKRGQTLDSLQYLVSLVVNKEKAGYIRVKVDTENYRQRRKATLENLAKNLSFKVKRTKRPVTLEPMNPYERRIIHSALQSDRYVTTHSEGEEPYRRVVITLK
ncbi:MAG: protein jag [Lachnospiraceae bacterium]|nr:protein jag [Lachnospiraceae bacterium]